jgi:hypothetical protein
MTKIKYNYNDVDDSKSGYTGEEPTPGIYPAKVFSAEVKKAQSSGNQMIEVVLEITSGEYKGWRDWHRLVQTPESMWKTKEFTDAIGLSTPGKKSGSWDTEDAVGKKCRIKTKREMYEGEPRGRVKSVLKAKDAEVEEDEAVEEQQQDDRTTDEAAGASDVWSWSDLEGLDRDDLKKVVKDEELDPKELGLSKNMETDEIRAKIAEALGVEVPSEEAAEEENPEDPF